MKVIVSAERQYLIITFIIIVLLGLCVKELIRGYQLFSKTFTSPLPEKMQLQKSSEAIAIDNRFLGRPVFGVYLQDAEDIQITKLDIKLVGILFDKPNPSVILQVAEQNEKSYFLGDTVMEGAVIKKITPLEVFLLYNGKLERLTLREARLTFNKITALSEK